MLNAAVLATVSGLSKVYRSFAPPLEFSAADVNGRPVAVFSTAGIGDTLTDTVAIRAIRETFPKSRLTVVAHEKRRAVLEHNPHIDELIPHAKRRWPATLSKLVRSGRPYLSVVLRANDPDIFPLAYAASRRVLANPARTRLPHLVTIPVWIPQEEWDRTHGVEQTLKLVGAIGAAVSDKHLVYAVTDMERQDARDLLSLHGMPTGTAIAMQVTRRSHGPARDWPVEHYGKLITLIRSGARADLHTRPVVLLGGPGERDLAETLAAGAGRSISLAGKLSLRQSAAVLSACACLVTPDTGLMHLSFAVGCRTIALLSILPPERVGPYGYPRDFHVCRMPPRGRGMDQLSPEEVYQSLAGVF